MLRRLLVLIALLTAWPAAAQPLAAGARNHVAAELVAESVRPAAGQAVTLAFAFTPEPGWHGYWINPGDAGQPMRVTWTLPRGVTAGALRFPVPSALLVSGLMNHVYEGPHAILLDLALPAGLAPGTTLPVRAKVDYLACTDQICVPQSAELSLALTAGDGAVAQDARQRFDGWRRALPQPLGGEGRFARAGGRLRVAVPLPAAMPVTGAYLFAATDGALRYAAPQTISRAGDMLIVETDAATGGAAPPRFEGLLALGGGRGLAFVATPGEVPAAGTPTPVIAPADRASADGATPPAPVTPGAGGFLLALLGALAGGLILNVMPCVFPILSLKALSLARAGTDADKAREEAVAYAGGIVVTCLALGGVLLALRAGGAAAGWAFQLQYPHIVLLLLLLVTAIALNLAGMFSLPGLSIAAGGSGAPGAFASGVLAAFIATPCTGPFMAAAFGAALLLPAAASLAIYGALGIGLALPFLAIAFVPALRRLLPRPGAWMETLQRILAVPMLLTALGLAWVLGRETGVGGMTLGVGAAVLLGVALWWLGGGSGGRAHRWTALALAGVTVAGAVALLDPTPPAKGAAVGASGLAVEPFTEARLAQLRAERTPVFVYFTADWCVACKVNEHGALASAEVADAFRRGRVRVLEGDWTLGDPAIGRFIEAQGRSGVPLYLYYSPGGAAQVLPQLLDREMLAALPPA